MRETVILLIMDTIFFIIALIADGFVAMASSGVVAVITCLLFDKLFGVLDKNAKKQQVEENIPLSKWKDSG